MGLTTALNAAVTGLKTSQAGVDLVSRNIANADSAGYVRKTANQQAIVSGGVVRGVQLNAVNRELDTFLQATLRSETSSSGYADVLAGYYGRIDQIFGEPGGANALDTIYASFETAANALSTSPEDTNAQDNFVRAAQTLAQQLNNLSNQVQSMRLEIEQRLDSAVDDVNSILSQLQQINATVNNSGTLAPDTADVRDRLLSDLSRYLNITTTQQPDGTINVQTTSGVSLLGPSASQLSFDPAGYMNAAAQYDRDPLQSGVGQITIQYGAGVKVDLIADRSLLSGEIGGLVKLRDDVLVTAQNQLDAIAGSLARSASDIDVAGTAVTSGAQEGYAIDYAGIQPGDTLTLNYTETPPGTARTVTLLNTTDPSGLPPNGSATALAGDTVVGVDFSAGPAAVVAAIQTALGASFTVSNPSGTTIQILDDGAVGTIDISGLKGTFTATGLQDGNASFPLFVDSGAYDQPYSAAFEGVPQAVGFAQRIKLNSQILGDPSLLVKYAATTASGDATRPSQLISRLESRQNTVSPSGGLNTKVPFNGTVGDFLRRVVSFQASEASAAAGAKEAQDIVVEQLNARFTERSGVDIDVELTLLISLQQAFQANARVISATQEMMDMLMRV